MAIDRRMLELLVCPACHGKVEPVDEDRGLACRECGRVYPVRDGIAVMLLSAASPPKVAGGEPPGGAVS